MLASSSNGAHRYLASVWAASIEMGFGSLAWVVPPLHNKPVGFELEWWCARWGPRHHTHFQHVLDPSNGSTLPPHEHDSKPARHWSHLPCSHSPPIEGARLSQVELVYLGANGKEVLDGFNVVVTGGCLEWRACVLVST